MFSIRHVSKSFGRLQALRDVSLEFAPGEVHAVLGENGAGKSTLMHVMAGYVTPDSGELELDGHAVPVGSPFECRRMGIGMVHQHFTLVPNFTVQENLALASLESATGSIELSEEAKAGLEAARRLGWEIPEKTLVSKLPVGVQQRVEIVKAIASGANVLIFDEPTAVLSPNEVLDLIRVLKSLRDEGKTVILIAHKLSEVLAVADRVSVLRKGEWIATAPRSEVDAPKLAHWMVGDLPEAVPKAEAHLRAGRVIGEGATVRGDRGDLAIDGIDFEIRRGEIVGFGGVDGNGQVELAEALAGVRESQGIRLTDGLEAETVAYIPQDRHQDGLALEASIEENLLIGGLDQPELLAGPFLRRGVIHSWAEGLIQRFRIKVENAADPVSSLSGGNQQKVVVSRSLARTPGLLVVVNPTRGLDIQAGEYVQSQILQARAEGAAVALFSTDLDELNLLADRLYFLGRGKLLSDFEATSVVGGQ